MVLFFDLNIYMLVSHTHKFIYLKTKKTGGTSVEAYLERFCLPDTITDYGSHDRSQIISDVGIVGSRNEGRSIADDIYYNHMPASRVKELVGDNVWNNYYKFCVMRNPWDRMVSKFWWQLQSQLRRYDEYPFSEVREFFEWFIENKPRWLADDVDIFTIDGKVIVDDVIRYEDFDNEMARVCAVLGETYDPAEMPKHKSGIRKRSNPYQDYYTDPKIKQIVAESHCVWIDHFGYTF